MKKNSVLIVLFIASVICSFSFTNWQNDKGYEIKKNPEFSNLKILPKDITKTELMDVMHNFNEALNVKCGFCHAPGANDKLDFASDENKHKNVAREMMKMTMGINKKYFKTKNPQEFEVTCYTCHNGEKHPAKKSEVEKKTD